jgi:hypothetical protein
MILGEVIVGHYDYRIVTLSVLIGVIGGYCTIELAERVTASRNRARLYWWIALVGGRARIISSPGKGTTIEVVLPLALRDERAGRGLPQ